MRERLKRIWYSLGTLDVRIYYTVLCSGIVAGVIATATTAAQGLGRGAVISTMACVVFLVGMLLYSYRVGGHQTACRLLLAGMFNFVLLPVAFFACGGIHSGMVMFFELGLFTVAVLLRGKLRIVMILLSLITLELSINLSQIRQDLVMPMSEAASFQDVKVTLLLTGFTLVTMALLILRAYENERKHNQELMEQLRSLSVRDTLSGLYNRRELFRRLELIYQGAPQVGARDGYYIAMFDVDNFKQINDTYGHLFGDKVLSGVSQVLHDACLPEDGELAARYGGEEFVCVIHAASFEAALERTETICRSVAALTWEDAPGISITVSGGMVACGRYPELERALQDVDKLLYQSKRSGKNRVSTVMA